MFVSNKNKSSVFWKQKSLTYTKLNKQLSKSTKTASNKRIKST